VEGGTKRRDLCWGKRGPSTEMHSEKGGLRLSIVWESIKVIVLHKRRWPSVGCLDMWGEKKRKRGGSG